MPANAESAFLSKLEWLLTAEQDKKALQLDMLVFNYFLIQKRILQNKAYIKYQNIKIYHVESCLPTIKQIETTYCITLRVTLQSKLPITESPILC